MIKTIISIKSPVLKPKENCIKDKGKLYPNFQALYRKKNLWMHGDSTDGH